MHLSPCFPATHSAHQWQHLEQMIWKTSFCLEWWPKQSSVRLWRHVCRLYILRACSAGTVVSCLVAYQATSIHQHKSAQRGANCIRRPWLFSVARACVGERERACGWRERCLKKSGSDSAWSPSQASPLSPVQLLAACPVPLHKQTHKMWGSNHNIIVNFTCGLCGTAACSVDCAVYRKSVLMLVKLSFWIRTSLRIVPFSFVLNWIFSEHSTMRDCSCAENTVFSSVFFVCLIFTGKMLFVTWTWLMCNYIVSIILSVLDSGFSDFAHILC